MDPWSFLLDELQNISGWNTACFYSGVHEFHHTSETLRWQLRGTANRGLVLPAQTVSSRDVSFPTGLLLSMQNIFKRAAFPMKLFHPIQSAYLTVSGGLHLHSSSTLCHQTSNSRCNRPCAKRSYPQVSISVDRITKETVTCILQKTDATYRVKAICRGRHREFGKKLGSKPR